MGAQVRAQGSERLSYQRINSKLERDAANISNNAFLSSHAHARTYTYI